MTTTPCDHCWHRISTYANGLGTAGTETHRCCHCGHTYDVPWTAAPDPKHGPYVDIRIRVVDEPTPR